MLKRLSHILDHVADMLSYAPAYMMGFEVVESEMVEQMHEMLKDMETVRKEIRLK